MNKVTIIHRSNTYSFESFVHNSLRIFHIAIPSIYFPFLSFRFSEGEFLETIIHRPNKMECNKNVNAINSAREKKKQPWKIIMKKIYNVKHPIAKACHIHMFVFSVSDRGIMQNRYSHTLYDSVRCSLNKPHNKTASLIIKF